MEKGQFKQKLKQLLKMFLTFFKIGITTFGGGYAMIPILQREVCEKKKWINDEEMLSIVAIAESTPGPVAINMATYVGYKVLGVLGAIFCTVGVVLPSFIIILCIALFFNNLMEYPIVVSIFNGIRCGVATLIIYTAIKLLRKVKKSAFNIVTFLLSFTALLLVNIFAWDFSAVYVILIGLVLSLCYTSICIYKEKKERKDEGDKK